VSWDPHRSCRRLLARPVSPLSPERRDSESEKMGRSAPSVDATEKLPPRSIYVKAGGITLMAKW